MLTDVLLRFGLECVGALGLRCAVGHCQHPHARVMVWLPFGLLTSWLTVSFVD